MEYCHRTYDHFVRMFHLLNEKLKRDEHKAEVDECRKSTDSAINLQNLLVQVQKVIDSLFMCDLSHLLTYRSKEFQRFDVLPFYPMNVADKVLSYLIAAGDSFKEGKIPDPIHLHVDSKQKEYVVWETFNNSAREILEEQNFKNVNLISPSERGRVTRRSTRIGCDKESYNLLFDQQLRSYGSYLHELANQFVFRFHPLSK